MYIWVVLATFIAILYAFNLSVRPDMRQIYIEPQAEATVSRIILQHQAATRYLMSKMPPSNGVSNITYTEGLLNIDDFRDYLPAGFNEAGNSEFYSMVYCINKNSAKLGTAAPSCDDNTAINYLVTYGCIPQRWKSIKGSRPSNDLMNVIKKRSGSGSNFGYTDDISQTDPNNKMGTSMMVNNGGKFVVSIPQYVISSDKGEDSFMNKCGANKKCPYCLIYMTPFERG